MNLKRLETIKDVEDVLKSESDIREFKEQIDSKLDKEKVIKNIVGMSNSDGGYFIIGIKEEKGQNNRTVYKIFNTSLDVDGFQNTVENWLDEYVDPRGQLKWDLYEVKNTKKRCIVIQVDTISGQCFGYRTDSRAYENTAYHFPIRLNGSTRYMDWSNFFPKAFNKYLSSFSAISALKIEEEGEPSRFISGPSSFNAEGANEYIDLLNNPDIDSIETRSKILENLWNLLPSIIVYDLEDIDKSTTNRIIDFIKNEIKNKNSLTICLDMLSILSSIRDDEIKDRLNGYFLGDIEKKYNDLTTEQKSDALRVLQDLNEYNPKYMKKLILEAINDWNDTDFERLSNEIAIYAIKDHVSTIRGELYALRSKAEKNGEEEKKKRIDAFIDRISQF